MNETQFLKTYLNNYLKTIANISSIGRAGKFIYMDIDTCIKEAFDFSDNLLGQMHE